MNQATQGDKLSARWVILSDNLTTKYGYDLAGDMLVTGCIPDTFLRAEHCNLTQHTTQFAANQDNYHDH